MNKNRVPFVLSVVCIVLGFMIALQYQHHQTPDYIDSRDINELRINLQKERERTQLLLSEISKHDQLLYQYEMYTNQEDQIASIMEQELQRLRLIAGLEEMTGEGFVLLIKQREDLDFVHHFAPLIFDEDLRMIVNELNAYGAKAIAINDQRLVNTSAIRNVGERILVNTIPVVPPYEIKVIGDHSILIPALKLAGIDEYFMVVNHEVIYRPMNDLTVPAYHFDIRPKYMQPVKEGNG
jgi:uncharacterized protein YlxW (UPF0749 family)